MRSVRRSAIFVLGMVLAASVFARPETPPKSLVYKRLGSGVLLGVDEIERWRMSPTGAQALLESERASGPGPFRVAIPMPVHAGPSSAGTWETLPDGGALWRLRVDSEGAVFLSFKLAALRLPAGAELHFVSIDRVYYDGPYTRRHARETRRFGSPMIPGSSAVIELYLPPGAGDATVEIESVSHGYKDVLGMGRFPMRDGSTPPRRVSPKAGNFDCQRDINCPEGAPYQNEKRAVAEGFDGSFVCSGQLVNNVRQDNRYLYLTAAHCEWWKDPAGMSYFWNYENSGCGTNDFPSFTFSTGSTDLYHDTPGDVNLLELDGTDLENTFNVYFMGWNRGTTAPSSAAMISHPADKPKQIVIRFDPVIDCEQGGCGGGWGGDWWRVTGWDVGVDEGGSSGGGLMDQDNLVVGVLTGGVGTDCNNFAWDEFAKIGPAWSQLQPFLDPDDTGALSVPGKDGLGGGGGNELPTFPSPADGASGVNVNADLSWTAGAGSDSSDVYFGTGPSPAFQGNQTAASFDPGTLAHDTAYTWRIDAVTGPDTVTGDTWSFTTASPVVEVVTITEAQYKSDKDELKVKATSSEQPAAVLTLVDFGQMTFNNGKYEYKESPFTGTVPQTVTVLSDLGGSDTAPVAGAPAGPALPGAASNPVPSDGVSGVTVNVLLSWTAGSDTESHDVYFGTAASPGPGELQGNQAGTSFDPGTLNEQTTYFWRIDEVNALGTTAGVVWSFATAAAGTTDLVTITEAKYKLDKDEFKVKATSSEQPSAVLTVVGFGQMTFKNDKYELKIKPLAPTPVPEDVTVVSSEGGSDTATVVNQ